MGSINNERPGPKFLKAVETLVDSAIEFGVQSGRWMRKVPRRSDRMVDLRAGAVRLRRICPPTPAQIVEGYGLPPTVTIDIQNQAQIVLPER